MKKISISDFKATCVEILEEVQRTGEPVRVTRYGKAIAEIVPPAGLPSSRVTSRGKFRLGGMEDKMKITGDLIAPVVAPEVWEVLRDKVPARHAKKGLKRRSVPARARKGKRGVRKRRDPQ